MSQIHLKTTKNVRPIKSSGLKEITGFATTLKHLTFKYKMETNRSNGAKMKIS